MSDQCLRRPVECPYQGFGCSPSGLFFQNFPLISNLSSELIAGDLDEHLQRCMNQHLMLVSNRVVEEQQVIVKLNRRVDFFFLSDLTNSL